MAANKAVPRPGSSLASEATISGIGSWLATGFGLDGSAGLGNARRRLPTGQVGCLREPPPIGETDRLCDVRVATRVTVQAR
jgi:hypothetical protein